MRTNIGCLIAALALLPAAAPLPAAESGAKSPEAILTELADKLLGEAERQHMVNHRMSAATKGMDALLKDLESNDLVRQGKGGSIKQFVKVLRILTSRHVPNAAKYLEEARKRLEALRPNLRAADAEIEIILELLSKLLDRAKSTGSADDLLTQLRILIRRQEKALKDTVVWGRRQIVAAKPDDAELARQGEELKMRQEQIAAGVRVFEGNLSAAHKASGDDPLREDRLGKALRAMKQMKIDKALDAAAADIERKKAVKAKAKQEAALDDLREIEKLLMTDLLSRQIDQMQEAREKLQEVLEKQKKLTEKTESTPEKEFAEKSKPQQVEQRNVEKQLEQAAKEVPQAAKPQVKEPLEKADKHMEQAQKAMAKTEQQQAVANQKEAEKSLEQAIKQLDQQIAQAEAQQQKQQQRQNAQNRLEQAQQQVQSLLKRQQQLAQATRQTEAKKLEQLSQPQSDLSKETKEAAESTKDASKPLEEAGKEMQEAAEAMQEGEKGETTQHQAAAVAALQQAEQAIQQAMEAARQPAQVATETPTTDPDEEGKRDFGKEKAKGRDPSGDKTHWDHLSAKQREALMQRFARELPQEYRELLEDYYEALSK